MDLQEFILKNLEIDKQKYGRIFSFVDFGNVNYWYEKNEREEMGSDPILPYGVRPLFIAIFIQQ